MTGGIHCDAQAVGGTCLVLASDTQGQKCQVLANPIIAPCSLGEGRKDETECSVVRVGRTESLLCEPRLPLLWGGGHRRHPPPIPPADIAVCILIVIPTYLHPLSLNDPDVAQRHTSTLTPFLFSNDL